MTERQVEAINALVHYGTLTLTADDTRTDFATFNRVADKGFATRTFTDQGVMYAPTDLANAYCARFGKPSEKIY